MSKREDFHPSLSTLDVAKFQLLELGFAGVTNGVTMVPAKDAETGEPVAVLVVFRPSVREGEANVQPIARIIDPWEVIEPEFAHTDGAGNVKEQVGGGNDNPGEAGGNKGNGADT